MKPTRLIALLAACLLSLSAFAQNGGFKGQVISRVGKTGVKDARITVVNHQEKTVQTDKDGYFVVEGLEAGEYIVKIEADYFFPTQVNVEVAQVIMDIFTISLTPQAVDGNPDESEFGEMDMESGDDAQSMPALLSSSRDVYDNISGYKFGAMRFKNRGYESSTQDIYINGIKFNEAVNGRANWSLWGGLNEAMRNQQRSTSYGTSTSGIGGPNGIVDINTKASDLRQGFRASLVNAAGMYRFRLMATYASGLMDNGWAYAFSVSTRQGTNDWMDGVYYNNWSYYGAVEKRFNDRNSLALTIFAAPTQRGVQGGTTQEVYDLMGSNFYNPNWGWQEGKMRNARVRDSHEPVFLLNYEYTPDDDFRMNVAASYRFGRNGYSALDWYDTQDPRPDYYRNLPSYYEEKDPWKAAMLTEAWKNDPNTQHLNWDRLYNVNYNSMGLEGMRRSKYVIEERRQDQQDFNLAFNFDKRFNEIFSLEGGLNSRFNRTEFFKSMKDLLGGHYWLDVDQFAERDFGEGDQIQNDLNHPDRKIKVGDKYGYDYYAYTVENNLWATWRTKVSKFEGSLSAEIGNVQFWREGLYRKGLFPENSFGRSDAPTFLTYRAKLSAYYFLTAYNTLAANVAYMNDAPYFTESFISPRTRNTLARDLTTEKTFAVDLTYKLRTRWIDLRVTGFYSTIQDQTKLMSFYDDINRSFTNFSMRGIDQRNYGLEVGLEIPIYRGLSFRGAASVGDYRYTSNPLVTQTIDNSEKVILNDAKVRWEGYHVASTPQTAINLGLNFRSNNYWFAGIDVNYFDRLYIDMNPLYRTDYAHVGLNYEQSQIMAHQERFKPAWIVNANVGKSWYIQRKYNIGFSLEIKNILNNTNVRTGGYEQSRLRANKDANDNVLNYERFDSKYFYMYGTTYYLNIYFRF